MCSNVCRFIAWGLLLFTGILVGCSNNRTPQESFDLTWAGLAGVDTFHFEGQAEVIQNEQPGYEHVLAYSGDIHHHTEMIVKVAPSSLASNPSRNKENTYIPARQASSGSSATFHLDADHGWIPVHLTPLNGGSWNLAAGSRMNPLAAIEELHKMTKCIREESGAARGTRVLRIEPDAQQEQQRISRQLHEELSKMSSSWQSQAIGSAETGNEIKVKASQWIADQQAQLMKIMGTAKVKTIYHLTISKRTHLPIRLTAETVLHFVDNGGTGHSESLWNDAKFTDYQ